MVYLYGGEYFNLGLIVKSVVLFPPPFYFVFDISNLLSYIQNNFKLRARSPRKGNHFSSIICRYVCMSVVCQITWNHVNHTRACSKSVLGGKILPVTPILFASTIR